MATGKRKDTPDFTLTFESSVSAKTGDPFILMRWGEHEGQLTPAEAKEHAFHVLEAVEASYTDAFLVRFLQDKLGAELPQAVIMLRELRAYRAALNERGV